ncbi:MAG: alkaline phytoceramidase [Pseudomonadota bacterium]
MNLVPLMYAEAEAGREQRAFYLLGSLFMAFLAVALFGLDPIPQAQEIHDYADPRSCFGLANCGDVLSNLGFTVAGLIGLWVLGRNNALFGPEEKTLKVLFLLFFIAVVMVSVASSYYHIVLHDQGLFWDRVPITLSFLTLFPAILADRVTARFGVWFAALAIPAGLASLVYWIATEAAGAGDLRFYGLVQAFPLFCLLIMPWLFPNARYSQTPYLYGMVGLYGVAKLVEVFDARVFELTGQLVSGHSLKHLLAAAACLVVVPMIRAGAAKGPATDGRLSGH